MRKISRKTGNGDDQSSMDIKLACNLSDRETPSSDSVEMQGTVVPGKSTFKILLHFFIVQSCANDLFLQLLGL